ncbi:CRP-like cAMP-binding protein [Methylobacterium sp. RAS18]|nr:CRP-like cAMP-binding protein [Methylobacterium sp. RAS18]
MLSGLACRHKFRANGARQINAYLLLPGDLCELDVALLDEMDHSITTISACQVVRLAPEVIADLPTNRPQIALALRKNRAGQNAFVRNLHPAKVSDSEGIIPNFRQSDDCLSVELNDIHVVS